VKVGLITLGCDKNTVDSERYLGELAECGSEYTDQLSDAEVILVNTCGFIDAAKKESIDALIEAAAYKSTGACRAVVAVGCLIERHRQELELALPEVDLFLGASETGRLATELRERGIGLGEAQLDHPGVRLHTGALPHVRYLKISEGCDHGCAFCAIPLMRGRHRSFAAGEVVREAQLLELQGAREINLVAQDLAHYGRDRRDGVRLPQLLRMLIEETSIPWIRLLYLYSAGITPELLEIIGAESRIVRYLDMPMQHANDVVLARMRRPERKRILRERVCRFRDAIPDVAIRTTCIVGFPGETEDQFAELLDFLGEIEFERVGAFTYSAQEGTRAAEFPDDVPEPLKRERLERLTELQRGITADRYENRTGRVARLIVDRALPDGTTQGRLPWQADDIDGVTIVDGMHSPGTILDVAVTDVIDDYDFRAAALAVSMGPPIPGSVRRQSLPIAGEPTTMGSYGR
jgi:ribosomal protein S12 methylthiotransferase